MRTTETRRDAVVWRRVAVLTICAALGGCSPGPQSWSHPGAYRDGPAEASPFSWGPIGASSLRDANQSAFDDAIPR